MVPIRLTNGHQLAATHADNILYFYSKHYKGTEENIVNLWLDGNIAKGLTFREVLMASPKTLKELVETYIKNGKPAYHGSVERIKTVYKYFRTPTESMPFLTSAGSAYNGFQFADMIGLTVCPYCNRNYVINEPHDKLATCQLDHFYDKSTYPFVALSFYNLIPTCGTCNHIKLDSKVELCNLYDPELQEKRLMTFRVKIKGSNYLDDQNAIMPEYYCSPDFKNNFTELKLDKLYMQHLDLMQEIIKKRHLYSSEYIDQLFAVFGGKLFKTREQLLTLLLSNFIEEDQLHKRPFSKLTKDLWEQFAYLDS